MSEEWPAPPRAERPALPRIEDLPLSAQGYDPARVQEAFDAFYRHLAQLDSTLRAVEAVELFRQQAGELRADLRSIRAAGWSPYPRGYPVTSTPSLGLGGVSDAVPRIALEVVFLVVVAVVVAVANFSALEIVLVMLLAFAITALVEWVATRDRKPAARPVAAPGPVVAVEPIVASVAEVAVEEELEESLGWAAFAEPSGPEALTVMGALSDSEVVLPEDEIEVVLPEDESEVVLPEDEIDAPEPEPEREPLVASEDTAAFALPEPEPEPESEPQEARSVEVLEGSEKKAEPPPTSEAEREPEPRGRFRRRRVHPKAEPEPEGWPARSFEVLEGSEEEAEPLPTSEAELEGSEKEAEPLPTSEAEPEQHVRVLPMPQPALERDLDPWERGFDFLDEEPGLDVAADEDELPLRRPRS
jgi:hypothetical protein